MLDTKMGRLESNWKKTSLLTSENCQVLTVEEWIVRMNRTFDMWLFPFAVICAHTTWRLKEILSNRKSWNCVSYLHMPPNCWHLFFFSNLRLDLDGIVRLLSNVFVKNSRKPETHLFGRPNIRTVHISNWQI